MDILEAIYTRRSIRKYTGEPVGEEEIRTIISAGCAAPSAHNRQPWEFVVIRKKEILSGISKFHPYAKMLEQAGCGIIVCGSSSKQDETGFLIEDCSAAIQNMLLAAHGIGLGTVWCGLYPIAKLTKPVSSLLNLPSEIIPVGLVVVGHKNEQKGRADRFDSSIIHYEAW